MSVDPIILKILNGVQSGVEVALGDGTYTFGSGRDDDIQLVDVSLLAGHARLRIAGAKIEIAAQAGSLDIAGQRIAENDGDWHPLEPLVVVAAGTTRFALGPRSTNWASVADQGRLADAVEASRLPPPDASPAGRRLDWRLLAAPLLALLIVAVAAGWFFVQPGGFASGRGMTGADGVHALRESLDKFPFGRGIEVRDEVDGAIFVTGYVATPVERRALAGAIEKTGVPARVRLYVLDDMRRDITDIIAAQKLPAEFTLSDKGVVTLAGVILSADRVQTLGTLIRDRVFGVSDVESKVRTSDAILGEARELLAASQLNTWLLLRVVGDTLEVSGALPAEKVDAWVGFLQTYASRFAKDLPLRSFVQLQPFAGGSGSTVAQRSSPLGLGRVPGGGGATPLDLEKLRKGNFTLDDLFVGTRAADGARPQQIDRAPGPAAATRGAPGSASLEARSGGPAGTVPQLANRDAGAPPPDGRTAPSAGPAAQAVGDAGIGVVRSSASAATVVGSALGADGSTAVARTSALDPPRRDQAVAVASLGSAPSSPRPRQDGPRSAAGGDAPGRSRPEGTGAAPADAPHRGPGTQPGAAEAEAAGGIRLQDSAPAAAVASVAAPAVREAARPGAVDDPERAAAQQTRAEGSSERKPAAATDAEGAAAPDDGRPTGSPALTGPPDPAPNAVSIDYLPASRGGSDDRSAVSDLRSRAAAALLRFRNGGGPTDGSMRDVENALALIQSLENGASTPPGAGKPVADWLLPIVSARDGRQGDTRPCWPSTDLTAVDLSPTLFWLDVLSATRTTSLKDFSDRERVLLLDVAFNPDSVRACGRRTPESAKVVDHSLYLREISRNPGFADFITRDVPRSDLDVVGVSLGQRRFVVTRDGVRYYEGSAPDRTSRLAAIGELGLLIQRSEGLAVQLFGQSVGWLVAD